MSTRNGGFKGGVRGCYDATPLEVDVHRLTIVCTSLLRSYTSLVIAKTRPTLAQVFHSVFHPCVSLQIYRTKHGVNKQYATVANTIACKNTALAPMIRSDLMPPRGSVRIEGYITKIFSDFRRTK